MLLKGLYELARILVLYIQKVYYDDPVVINESFLKIDKPTIVVSNHPNTLLDAVFAAAAVNKQVNFLANYSLYKSVFGNWFFSTFYCIPIQRPEDVQEQPIDNKDSLLRSHEFLAQGGNLYIAVEGYSIQTIGTRELKTGTARIALSTESENDWDIDIQILPIGLNYDKADRFRSNLVLNAGEPFNVRKWRSEFEKDPRKAARDVTDYLQEAMESLTFKGDQRRFTILQKLRTINQNLLPSEPKREYLRSRRILAILNKMHDQELLRIENNIKSFENHCTSLGLDPMMVTAASITDRPSIRLTDLLWSLPITFLGFIINIIPYSLCHWIEQKTNKHLVYRTTFRVLIGLILFPLMYLFWMSMIYSISSSWILTIASLFTFRRSGIFSWHQIQNWKKYFALKKCKTLMDKDDSILSGLNSLLSTIKKHQL